MPIRPMLPLSETDREQWKARVTEAEALLKKQTGRWDTNLERYAPPVGKTVEGVNTNKDFTQAEAKKAAIFYDTPEIALTPKPSYEAFAEAIGQREQILNALIGPERANIKSAELKGLIDALVPSGFGVFKIGYKATTIPLEVPPQLDPMTGAEMAPGQTVDVPIHEELFYTRVSPKAVLLPSELRESNADKAPWIGERFHLPRRVAIREFNLTPEQGEDLSSAKPGEIVFNPSGAPPSSLKSDLVSGVAIWYQAALYDDAEIHPLKIRELVFLDGLDDPVRHNDSPYQKFLPTGQIDPASMIGYPIDLSSLRDLPDSPWVPSDSTMTRQLIDELNQFRTQMVKGRDANRPKMGYDSEKVGADLKAAIEAGEVGDWIPLPAGVLEAGGIGTIMAPIASTSEPRQNYDAQNYIERDRQETLAISPNQAGAMSETNRSATEVQTVQANAAGRHQQERRRWLEGTLRRLRKFDALVQQFPIQRDVEDILGVEQAQAYLQVAQQLAGAFKYAIKPDSGVFIDAVQDRQQSLSLYNLLRQDPLVNPSALLDGVIRKHHLDPAKIIVQPQPAGPPHPAVSYRFTGADFVGPQAPIVAAIAASAGLSIDPALLQAGMQNQAILEASQPAVAPKQGEMPAETAHGGVAEKAEPLDAHQMHLTGGTQGMAGGGSQSRGGFGVQ